MPSLVAWTVLHLVPPFALSTNMAARTHNVSLLTQARVVPSLVLAIDGRMPPIRPRDAEALGGIRRRRHAASVPQENCCVRCSRRGAMVASEDRDIAGRLHGRFYTRKSVQHSSMLASLREFAGISAFLSRFGAVAMNAISSIRSANCVSQRVSSANPCRWSLPVTAPIAPTPTLDFVWRVISLLDSAGVIARMPRACASNG